MQEIPCPFVYANGKSCEGFVNRVEAYKADLEWSFVDAEQRWAFRYSPRSHYHLFCSLKGNHAGTLRQDDVRMKFYGDELPDQLQEAMHLESPS